MTKCTLGGIVAILCGAMCIGCATRSALEPFPAQGSEKIVQHAADVLIDGVHQTRATGREVAGWCWNDKRTSSLASVAAAGVGDYEGVGVVVPVDPRSSQYVSCVWHTHPWGPHVAPGPSRQDLRSSMLPGANNISHFVLDQHGIWQYRGGRMITMCPWNSAGTNFDAAECRTQVDSPNRTDVQVVRYYGRRE